MHKEPNNDTIEYFIKMLNSIAIDSIPKTATPNKQNTPWFSNKWQEAIKLRKAGLKKFQKNINETEQRHKKR